MARPLLAAHAATCAAIACLVLTRRAERQKARPPPRPTLPAAGFHRRPLPPPALAMSSAEGRLLHREALLAGGMEIFFPLAEAFHTQAEPTFCGLGTLVTVLNGLEVDPGVVLVGAWRWYSEAMLPCCVDLRRIEAEGLTLDEWACVARCQGLAVEMTRAEDATLDDFRSAVRLSCASTTHALCVSYTRRSLNQTGDGHFSPLGGFHAASDRVLLLDVARFKHPPHWLPLAALWEAMLAPDAATGRSRGYALLSRAGGLSPPAALALTFARGRVAAARHFFAVELRRAHTLLFLHTLSLPAKPLLPPHPKPTPPLLSAHPSLPAHLLSHHTPSPATPLPPTRLHQRQRQLTPPSSRYPHSQVAALCTVRDVEAAEVLLRSPLHAAVKRASSLLGRALGPPPARLPACTALLLLSGAFLSPQALAASLPLSAPLLRESLEAEALRLEVEAAWEQLRLLGDADGCIEG
ncbi:hypothetical protein AB1Y20_022798 [Prymnesium parvum]|uniref:glutathione gamma-glutamylcysteinyltransferase n=1 Tax=Prymnesium parvum TaxID=97485 RepID=A0AB34JBX9_PRYPA